MKTGTELSEHILLKNRKRWETEQLTTMRMKGRKPNDDKWKSKYKTPKNPNTRFLPALPQDWCWVTVEQIASNHRLGQMLDKEKNQGEFRPYLRNLNVQWFEFDLSDIKSMRVRDEDLDNVSVRKGDLVICEGGEPGRAAIWEKEEPMVFQKALHRVRCGEVAILKFLCYYLALDARTGRLEKHFTGSTIKHFTGVSLLKYPFPLPPLIEIKKIVTILENCDAILQSTQALIARLRMLKRGLMQRLFTKGISHAEFKETKLGMLPACWEVTRLENIMEIHDSKRIPLSKAERSKRQGSYPYCGANGIIDHIDDYIFDGEYVLIAEDGGSYGRFQDSAYLMSGKFWVNNHAHILLTKKGMATNKFILYALNYLNLLPYIVGSTRHKLNQAALRSIKIFVPTIEEQMNISEILSTVDDTIQMEYKYIDNLSITKKGLMQELLTGKKCVKVN